MYTHTHIHAYTHTHIHTYTHTHIPVIWQSKYSGRIRRVCLCKYLYYMQNVWAYVYIAYTCMYTYTHITYHNSPSVWDSLIFVYTYIYRTYILICIYTYHIMCIYIHVWYIYTYMYIHISYTYMHASYHTKIQVDARRMRRASLCKQLYCMSRCILYICMYLHTYILHILMYIYIHRSRITPVEVFETHEAGGLVRGIVLYPHLHSVWIYVFTCI